MTPLMRRVLLFVKGMCMGVADVIPGVSGGTLALVLGVYKELVDTIRGLNPRVLLTAWRWWRGGRSEEGRAEVVAELEALNLLFLVNLGAGIATAIVVGSLFIPTLLESYPVQMKGFFFGLIVASVFVPARMIAKASGGKVGTIAAAVVFGVLGAAAGWLATDPGRPMGAATTEVAVESTGETLETLARRAPTSATLEEVYWAPQNEPLRASAIANQPDEALALELARASQQDVGLDKKALKARSEPYKEIEVPSGMSVTMPQPALWFVALAGMVAICAMILPGISGSYILLVFGVYFFILNAVKGLLTMLAKGVVPWANLTYVGVFIAAMIVGILGFSRVLSYLLREHEEVTLGVLVGLMIGCLRGIWPFQDPASAIPVNVWPGAATPGLTGAVAAGVVGFALVAGLTWWGVRNERAGAEAEAEAA